MFSDIVLIDYAKPLKARLESRKYCGPYHWKPTEAGKGRGFYQASSGLRVDAHGSSFDLRLELANDHIRRSARFRYVEGYYCDEFQDCTMVPVIARLPHSRGFLAGWTMGNGMCGSLGGTVYTTAEDAAIAAHSDAEYDAQRQREFEEQERARIAEEEREAEERNAEMDTLERDY